MLFLKKKYINLILFILLLLLIIFVLIFSEKIYNIESLENKDEDKCKPSKFMHLTSQNGFVDTHNIIQHTGHKIKKSSKCLFSGGVSAITDKLAQAKARHTAINKKN